MQLIGHGIDMTDCRRIRDLLDRHGRRFLDRVFTPDEQRYSHRHRNAVERLAGRFAVKEAVMKMLGTGWRGGVAWTDIETVNDVAGRPMVRLTGVCAELAQQRGITQISVSLTHTADLAVASVLALGRGGPCSTEERLEP